MRIMGLDYGSKTVGVAISDALGLTAQGIEIIRRTQENKLRQTLARIEALVKEYEVTAIVLGFPKNMNNTIGDRAEKSLAFKEMLERRTGLDVFMWDEDGGSKPHADRRRGAPGESRKIRGQAGCDIYITGIPGLKRRKGVIFAWRKLNLSRMEKQRQWSFLSLSRQDCAA